MEKKNLKASKDSQGYYEVKEYGKIVWDGYADNANQAKEYAIENYENKQFDDSEWA